MPKNPTNIDLKKININRVAAVALEAALHADQPDNRKPKKRHLPLGTLAAGAAAVAAVRTAQKHPHLTKFALKRMGLPTLDDLGDLTDAVKTRFAGPVHDDEEGADDEDYEDDDEDYEDDDEPSDEDWDEPDDEDDEDDELQDSDDDAVDEPRDESDDEPRDESDDEPRDELDDEPRDELDDEPANEQEPQAEEQEPQAEDDEPLDEEDDEPGDVDDDERDQPGVTVEVTNGNGRGAGRTPELLSVLGERGHRPPVLENLRRRLDPAQRPPRPVERTTPKRGRKRRSDSREPARQ
jgi:hypothetical protein